MTMTNDRSRANVNKQTIHEVEAKLKLLISMCIIIEGHKTRMIIIFAWIQYAFLYSTRALW